MFLLSEIRWIACFPAHFIPLMEKPNNQLSCSSGDDESHRQALLKQISDFSDKQPRCQLETTAKIWPLVID